MKKKSIKLFSIIGASLLLLTACDNSESTTTGYIAETLFEAIENTRNDYQMNIETGLGYSYPYQIINDEFYYYAPGVENYILLDEDDEFYHSFERTQLNVQETYRFGMDVHGRAGKISDKETLYTTDFMDILDTYSDDFVKLDEDTYYCSIKALAYELKEYFQNRAFSYCNYFEVDLGNDGRISSFRSYEKSLETASLVGEVSFVKFDKNAFEPYTLWNQSGRKINLRILDLKLGSYTNNNLNTYKLFYANEEVEIEGIVSSFDYNNNFVIAVDDNVSGCVGVQVTLKDQTKLPLINERIKVKGTVYQNKFVGQIIDASYTSISLEQTHPVFSEEQIVSSYGGGYFAAYIFAFTPIYSDSVYTTYAYVSSLPNEIEENKDTYIEVICPTQKVENDTFHMQIVLPKEMSVEERKTVVDDLKQYGVYSETNNVASEICFDNFIIRFYPEYNYHVQLEYGKQSEIYKSLSPQEKVEKMFGISNFPFPSAETYNYFTFGGSTGMSLETTYGEEGNTVGVYYNVSSLKATLIDEEIENLKKIGFVFYDEIYDEGHSLHQIYKKDNVYVDILLADAMYTEDEKMFSMWIYQGDLISMPSIEEIIESKIPYFSVDDFVKPTGITSSDISFYQLQNYAGITFEEGNYLNCIVIDVNEDCFSALRSAYLNEKGFKTFRNEDNKPYTYTTRGTNHYVYYKEIEGSSEKVFVDMAMYPTSSYTFAGHNRFTNRIEVLVYKGENPLSTHYENNLNDFSNYMNETYGSGSFNVNFSVETKVEYYRALPDGKGYDYLYYGYYYEFDAFLYSKDLNATYNDVIKGLTDAGYSLSTITEKGNVCYSKPTDSGYGVFVFIIKEDGYIRIIDGVGGLDF